MSIPNSRGVLRRPIHPGEMLREDFMPEYTLTVAGADRGRGRVAAVGE